MSNVQAKIQNSTEDLKESAQELTRSVSAGAAAHLDNLETSIRRNPMASVGVAAGIGFLLALIARR